MNKKLSCNCSQREFDAQQSYEILNKKFFALAQLVKEIVEPPKKFNKSATKISTLNKIKWIIGGDDVLPGEFPECCVVGISGSAGVEWRCTGVLINKRTVLTAGHCFSPYAKFEVAFNAVSLDNLESAEQIAVKKAVLHPGYNSTFMSNDVCVMILVSEAITEPIPAASSLEINQAMQTQLVGFGSHNPAGNTGFGTKREVSVPITSMKRGSDHDVSDEEYKYAYNSELEFVAGENGYGSCHGDSGGPAYIMVNGKRKVAGVTSRGAGGQHTCGNGAIYSRLDVYTDFINNTLRQYQ